MYHAHLQLDAERRYLQGAPGYVRVRRGDKKHAIPAREGCLTCFVGAQPPTAAACPPPGLPNHARRAVLKMYRAQCTHGGVGIHAQAARTPEARLDLETDKNWRSEAALTGPPSRQAAGHAPPAAARRLRPPAFSALSPCVHTGDSERPRRKARSTWAHRAAPSAALRLLEFRNACAQHWACRASELRLFMIPAVVNQAAGSLQGSASRATECDGLGSGRGAPTAGARAVGTARVRYHRA